MKVRDLIEKVKFQEDRIKLLEGKLKTVTEYLAKRSKEEAGHLSLENRVNALNELKKGLEKRIGELERFHPSVCRGPSDYEGWPPRKGIPHDHSYDKK